MKTKILVVILVLAGFFINADDIFACSTNQAPVAHLDAIPQHVYLGDSVILDGSGSYDPDGYIVEWKWHFGDGTS